MKVSLDLTNTTDDFPDLVGWYFRGEDKWIGPFEAIEQAKGHPEYKSAREVRTFVFVNVTAGFIEM